jgi:hypothetical protein
MHPIPDSESLKQVDAHFLKNIRVGDRVFQQSPSIEFTMYSVIGLPTDADLILMGAFDENEEPQQFTRKSMLAGDWWYNPLF